MKDSSAANIIESMIQQIDRPGVRYNCTCQVGGVDAVSLDTDWLLHMLRKAKAAAVSEIANDA